METYFVKALNSSRIKKKPLIVSLTKDNSLNWLNSWISEGNRQSIEKNNACVLISIHTSEADSQYQSFKRFIKSLDDVHNDITDDNQLVIIHNNEVQFVIDDSMDNEEKNEVLKAFIIDFEDEVKKLRARRKPLQAHTRKNI